MTAQAMPDDVCWWDLVGDRLEKEGVNPGHIFEFHEKIHDDLEDGGIVVSTRDPGDAPRDVRDISRVFLKDIQGEIHEMPPGRPIFLFNSHKISKYM